MNILKVITMKHQSLSSSQTSMVCWLLASYRDLQTCSLSLQPVCSPFPSSFTMRNQEKPETRCRKDKKEKQTSVHSVAIRPLRHRLLTVSSSGPPPSSEATSPDSQVLWSMTRGKARKRTQACELGDTSEDTGTPRHNCQFSREPQGRGCRTTRLPRVLPASSPLIYPYTCPGRLRVLGLVAGATVNIFSVKSLLAGLPWCLTVKNLPCIYTLSYVK